MSLPEIDAERYQQEAEYWCAYERQHEKEVESLMSDGGECDPHDGANFCEAIGNAENWLRDEITKALSEKKIDFDAFGRLVYNFALDYWTAEAEEKATCIMEAPHD